ncbi:hypothetical protein [Neobacillus niacini]|uniref:hypothetical protein n=1 Tax=Neobacillus niacini TaxID=86668 RepID=UPI0021CB6852|nr:hypothetical protein [Neobacillus niacini]MCM3764806.1 hypothetical protein [Neobacillus niacini]
MTNTTNNKRGNSPGRDNNLDHASIKNGLNNDNAFSENGLENNRLLNETVSQHKSE